MPQGSILGPFLFPVYVNDLPLSIFSSVLLFADDNKCFKTISSHFDNFLLQQDISSLLDWSKSWNLCFNEQKCILVKFSASTPKVCEDYSLNDHILNTSSSHKDLGIIISSDLYWSDHFQYISSQAYKTFGLLRHTFCNCNSIHA